MRTFVRAMLVVLLASQPGGSVAAQSEGDPSLERAKLALETKRLDLELKRFELEKERQRTNLASETKRLELELKRFKFEKEKQRYPDWFVPVLTAFGAALAGYLVQLASRSRAEKLQFQLKAAELVMAAQEADQAKQRAVFLARLFPDQLNALETAVKGSMPYFGTSKAERQQLLSLLAEYPESRPEILRAWGILFPWLRGSNRWEEKKAEEKATYKWLDELEKDGCMVESRPTARAD